MDHATRQPIYRQIEKQRRTKVITLVTGDRMGLQTQIAGDAVEPLVSVLDQIGPTKKLSLLLDTYGGHTSAAWRLINLIRSFCDELEVIVVSKAMSAGTLMALGANSIVMTKQAVLGPIDPSLNDHPLAPSYVNALGQTMRANVSAEAVRGFIDEVKRDVTEPAALAEVWNNLSKQIHPLLLGEIFRLGGQIRSLAKDLIQHQVEDGEVQDRIIQHLCSDSGSHDYTLNRRKATELGLKINKPSAKLYGLLSGLKKSLADQLKTLEPYSPMAMLGTNPEVDYQLVRGLIESTEVGCYGFVTEGKLRLNPAPVPGVQDLKAFEGWRKLP